MTKNIVFVKMGTVERCKFGRDGRLHCHYPIGWSENGNTQPWRTRLEACADARMQGGRATFVDELKSYPLIGGGTTTDYLESLKNQRTFACNFQEIKMLEKLIKQEERKRSK